ncbi:MAG: cyclic nucleotide-binding domain-containing protein [Leptospiraceae bacterium]|nr:cyclic nucleotide-binding domain-containing protein [Leptospiraceae bacterium]MCP5498038.1 cyclic nucleotide-binding domain-containing protein [Leptospiraceae bacterium]
MDTQDIIKTAKVFTFQEGETICSENDPAEDGLFFVLSGVVAVYKNVNKEKVFLSYISKGNFFGEMSLILNTPRQATVVADTDNVKVVALNKEVFVKAVHSNFNFTKTLVSATIQRIVRLETYIELVETPIKLKIPQILENVIASNRQNNLKLPTYIYHATQAISTKGNVLFSENEENDQNFYLVLKGKVGLFRHYKEKEINIGTMEPGDFFGHKALGDLSQRSYTAKTLENNVELLTLNSTIFYKVMKLDPELFFNVFRTFLTDLIILQEEYINSRKEQ